MFNPDQLEPETRTDITGLTTFGQSVADCGCDLTRPRWSVCDYHAGFNTAVERFKPRREQHDEAGQWPFVEAFHEAILAYGSSIEPIAIPDGALDRPLDTAALDHGTAT